MLSVKGARVLKIRDVTVYADYMLGKLVIRKVA